MNNNEMKKFKVPLTRALKTVECVGESLTKHV